MQLAARLAPSFLAALLLLSCSEVSPDSSSGGQPPPPPPPPPPPTIVSGPTLLVNPNPQAPLAARVEVSTDVPTRVTLTIDDGAIVWSVTPEPTYSIDHQTPLLGVRPDRTHTIQVEVRDLNGLSTIAPTPLSWTTGPLPADFPPLYIDVSVPSRMEPGVTLMAPSPSNVPGAPSIRPMFLLNAQGEVIWYFLSDSGIGDARRISNGNLLYMTGAGYIAEIDMFGERVGVWWASNLGTQNAPPNSVFVATDRFHHEVYELPAGDAADFLTLSLEMRQIPNYPANELDPTQTVPLANVVGDVIVMFKRDGTVVQEWKLLDLLDPYRLSYESLQGFWNNVYGTTTYDWSHGNAVILDPSDDSLIVSLRHQDVVFKLDRATGQLVWILGDHARWNLPWSAKLLTPVRSKGDFQGASPNGLVLGDRFEWNYHQHAPQLMAGGRIMLFDNGNLRAIPPQPGLALEDRYSRAVEFEIDPLKRTVRQAWDYGGPENQWYAAFIGDADSLPATGNVLITDGAEEDSTTHVNWARVFEVTHEQPGEIVFQARVQDPSTTNPISWTIYRAERLEDVYP